MKKQTIIVSGILNRKGRVLIAKRPFTKRIAPGKYHLPGGHVEFGEDPQETLVREFLEEFKIHISVKDLVNVFSYVYDETHTVGITYLLESDYIPENIWFDRKDTESIYWADRKEAREFLGSDDHDMQTLEKYFKLIDK